MRRYDGSAGPGTRVFLARATETGYDVRGTVLERPEDLLGLDLPAMAAYDGPLWLVCTNGKRDRCCAEIGRPIAGLLSQEWPEGTWETTHLGGHRFSGTLLALPSGITLGRLDTSNALAACEAVERGELPADLVRGRAGSPGGRAGAGAARARRRGPAGRDRRRRRARVAGSPAVTTR